MCFCDPWNSPIWKTGCHYTQPLRVLEREFHLKCFFFTQPNYAELKFHNGQTNCCYDFCGNQLLGKLVFSLSINRGLVTVFGCHPATPRGRGSGAIDFWIRSLGRATSCCNLRPLGPMMWKWSSACEVVSRVHAGVLSWKSDLSWLPVVEFLIAICAEVLFQLSVDAYTTYLHDAAWYQIQIDHNIQIYIYI